MSLTSKVPTKKKRKKGLADYFGTAKSAPAMSAPAMSVQSVSESHSSPVFTVVLPYVRKGHTKEFIIDTLIKSGLGSIQNTMLLEKAADLYGWFYEVTVEFKTFPNEELKVFLENGGVIKIFFNKKNFWKIKASVCPPRQEPTAPILVPHLELPLRVHSVYPIPDKRSL